MPEGGVHASWIFSEQPDNRSVKFNSWGRGASLRRVRISIFCKCSSILSLKKPEEGKIYTYLPRGETLQFYINWPFYQKGLLGEYFFQNKHNGNRKKHIVALKFLTNFLRPPWGCLNDCLFQNQSTPLFKCYKIMMIILKPALPPHLWWTLRMSGWICCHLG